MSLHIGGSQKTGSGTPHLRSPHSSVTERRALWDYEMYFLPSDGTQVKQIDGFIPVPSVNLLAVSKDMQTNFIHQKQKIYLSGKTCFFFFLWKNVNRKDKIWSSSWASYAFLCSV